MKYDQRFFNSFETGGGATSMTSGFQLISASSLGSSFFLFPLRAMTLGCELFRVGHFFLNPVPAYSRKWQYGMPDPRRLRL